MTGILIIDKPAGWTSHDVVAKLRGVLKEKRIGHGGTLDPMATGVLPIFIGRATRASEFCVNSEKEYIAGLKPGIVTDTQDITGDTISICEASVTTDDFFHVIPYFLGAQKQIPPMYSAIKQNGNKLYELARRGVEVTRPARDIYISNIELLKYDGGEFTLRIVCSKGTYIRTLCHDIGQALGCGGTLSSLRRTKAGAFSIDMAHTPDEIQSAVQSGDIEKFLTNTDAMFSGYPAVTLDEPDSRRCRNGAPCPVRGLAEGTYRFYGPHDEFILLGEVINAEIRIIKSFFEV